MSTKGYRAAVGDRGAGALGRGYSAERCRRRRSPSGSVEGRVEADQIGLLINTSVCRDWIEPSTACIVHGKLGSSYCISYDLGNARLAFMNGMDTAAHLIETGQLITR